MRLETVDVPAILVTADCQIDKPKAERLHFAPIRPISRLHPSDLAAARRDRLDPYDFLRIVMGDGAEVFCRPGETFWLPIEYFAAPTWIEDENGDKLRCLDVERLGTLPTERLELFKSKLNVFWTGRRPIIEPPPQLFDDVPGDA